jgi:IS5 family transposase
VLRTVSDQATLWELILPVELLVLPAELSGVDALLDDAVFFAPFAPYFDARMGRPSIPMETYLRLMFLKFRYRLGYESLCREVADSISWQRFCRIPFGTRVPHPTTLMKITTRCGDTAVAGLNEALLAKPGCTVIFWVVSAPLRRDALVRHENQGCRRTDSGRHEGHLADATISCRSGAVGVF